MNYICLIPVTDIPDLKFFGVSEWQRLTIYERDVVNCRFSRISFDPCVRCPVYKIIKRSVT